MSRPLRTMIVSLPGARAKRTAPSLLVSAKVLRVVGRAKMWILAPGTTRPDLNSVTQMSSCHGDRLTITERFVTLTTAHEDAVPPFIARRYTPGLIGGRLTWRE